MVKIERITLEEAKATRRQMKKSPKIKEYEEIVLDLTEGEAIRIDAKVENEKPQTIKNRIIRIGKYHGIKNLKIQRRGDKISFWIEKKPAPRIESPNTQEQS